MSEPFIGQLKLFAGNFAPRGYAFCDGQLLSTTQNDALFSLFGTLYGGDGRATFGLPDMRGRLAIHTGQGPGLSNRVQGSKIGLEDVPLNENQLPVHTHELQARADLAQQATPQSNVLAHALTFDVYRTIPTSIIGMNTNAITSTGTPSPSHDNIQPFLCINCIVALAGVFPSRN